MKNNLILIIIAVCAVILSGLFSGSETGMYQFSRLRLRLGIEKKKFSFIVLGKAMRDHAGMLLSILVGTNLALYIITSIATMFFLARTSSEYTAELLATLITAPALFVFTELIPKNIFYYRADSLMLRAAPLLLFFHRLFTWMGIIPLLRLISRAVVKLTGSTTYSTMTMLPAERKNIQAIFRETHEEGFLSSVQTTMMNRLTTISNTTLKAVMTPLVKAHILDVNTDRDTLLNELSKHLFTRLPVYEKTPTNIIGHINIYKALGSEKDFTCLHDFLEPIQRLPADTVVIDAINLMKNLNSRMVLVIRKTSIAHHRPIGIATMKDLVEELLGELAEW